MADKSEVKKKAYRSFISRQRCDFNAFEYNILYGIDISWLNKKRVLDIGAGDGWRTIFYALYGGAEDVFGIDNYIGDGSDKSNERKIFQLIEQTKTDNVFVIVDDYLEHKFYEGSFDIIFATDSLHHMFSSKKRASCDSAVYDAYLSIVKKIYFELKSGGRLCVRELQKFSLARYIPYWNTAIHWHDKQQASDWCQVFNAAGFQNIQLHYYVPYKLRSFSSLLKNCAANFLLKSVYTITAQKP